MNITIPIYTETYRESGRVIYNCDSLFHQQISGRDASLQRATNKMLKKLKKHADSLAAESRHDELIDFAFNPHLESRTLKLSLDLRDRKVKCKLLFVELTQHDRRVAFSPSVPDVWFDIQDDEELRDRAEDVLSQHYRDRAKQHRTTSDNTTVPSLEGQAWVSVVDVAVSEGGAKRKESVDKFAALWDDSKMHGATELSNCGRCLDWLYPDALHRAAMREHEVNELQRVMAGTDRRPVLLVGPPQSGKTSVLHELVYRRVKSRKRPFATKCNVWLLSPQRLISGMSYVGQWENRLLAILKEARRRDHVLYFDDMMGLYQAGKSSDSSLCIADVMRSYLLRRDVRVVGEMSTEALAKFRERDRGLADQFHILPVQPSSDDDTLRILLQVRRQQEAEHRCHFAPEAIPTVLEITRRYERESAFPGKAAGLLQHLASKRAGKEVDRTAVYDEYHAKTGLSLALLDGRRPLAPKSVLERLEHEVIGQTEAIDACCDVVMAAKAGLNDPNCALATLLFLGPTGVGKTQCAKALAKVMFTDESRLLRFDMNEFVTPYSAARLVGTLNEPEGLLTSAVRQQPHSIVLFDEIEKAHPDVFDLLLQVTGEGRLTDTLGRTTNFGNTVIVMTSNLGVRESVGKLGLRSDAASHRQTYLKAVQQFFRPEFFNRIDRVIPFEMLGRTEMQSIAELLLSDLLKREGLVRRSCALQVDRRAMQQIIDEGYHPQLGARALKRAIEKQLTQPVAARLAESSSTTTTLINVYRQGDRIVPDVHVLKPVADTNCTRNGQGDAFLRDSNELVEHSRRLVARLKPLIADIKPATDVDTNHVNDNQLRYFALKEQLREVSVLAEAAAVRLHDLRHGAIRPELGLSVRDVSQQELWLSDRGSPKRFMREVQSAEDINDFVRESAEQASTPLSTVEHELNTLKQESAWLWAMWRGRDMPERVALLFHKPSGDRVAGKRSQASSLFGHYALLFKMELAFDLETIMLGDDNLKAHVISGSFVWPLLLQEQGTHLIRQSSGNLLPVQLSLLAIDGTVDAATAILDHEAERDDWLDKLAAGESTLAENPFTPGPIIRTYDADGVTEDMRSRIQIDGWPSVKQLNEMLFSGLERPPHDEDQL